MRCTVTWDPGSQSELARIWMEAADPMAVTLAANEIDRLLKFSALSVGEDLGNFRRLVEWPLEVGYTVSTEDCLVTIYQVAYIG